MPARPAPAPGVTSQVTYPNLAQGEPVQFRTIQRADLVVAVLIPPAVIAAVLGDKLPNLLITAAAVAVIRAVFVRSILTAYKAGLNQSATVHDLADRRRSLELVTPAPGAGDLN